MVVLDGCDEMNGNLLRIGEHSNFFFSFFLFAIYCLYGLKI